MRVRIAAAVRSAASAVVPAEARRRTRSAAGIRFTRCWWSTCKQYARRCELGRECKSTRRRRVTSIRTLPQIDPVLQPRFEECGHVRPAHAVAIREIETLLSRRPAGFGDAHHRRAVVE